MVFLLKLFWPSHRIYHAAMFRIVLQPGEQVVLGLIREGLYPASMVYEPVVRGLMALRLVVFDEHGLLRLTPLAEAALARVGGRIH